MVTRLRRAALRAAFAAFLGTLSPAFGQAAGFSVFEQGARSMGFAGAYTAVANDPTAIYHNAGGVAFLKGKRLHLGATFQQPSFDFVGAPPFPGTSSVATSGSRPLPVPSGDYTHQFSETVVFGLGLHEPFALQTEWDDPDRFPGRFLAQNTKLHAWSLNPTVAFRLADRFGLGVGVDVRVASLDFARKIPAINPFNLKVADIARADVSTDTGTGFGFNLGILARPSEESSIGLSYRHKVTVDLSGTTVYNPIPTGNPQLDTLVSATLPNGSTPFETSLTFPSLFSAGLAFRPGDWVFSFQADFTQWSSFDVLEIAYTTRPDLSQTVTLAYTNTWDFRAGVERVLSQAFTVRAGYARESSPVPAESLSPLFPDSTRNVFAGGGSWTNGRARFDLALRYRKGSERSTEGRSRDAFDGFYKGSGFAVGLALAYEF